MTGETRCILPLANILPIIKLSLNVAKRSLLGWQIWDTGTLYGTLYGTHLSWGKATLLNYRALGVTVYGPLVKNAGTLDWDTWDT